MQLAVNAVVHQVGAISPTARLDALAQDRDHFFKLLSSYIPVRISATKDLKQRRLVPRLRAALSHHLLHQHIDGLRWNFKPVKFPCRTLRTSAACSSKSSRVVAKSRPFGTAPRQCPALPMRCTATA